MEIDKYTQNQLTALKAQFLEIQEDIKKSKDGVDMYNTILANKEYFQHFSFVTSGWEGQLRESKSQRSKSFMKDEVENVLISIDKQLQDLKG